MTQTTESRHLLVTSFSEVRPLTTEIYDSPFLTDRLFSWEFRNKTYPIF